MNITFKSILNICISVFLSLFLVKILTEEQILMWLIIFGQGHFFLSYFYTYKAGKINSLFLKKFFGLWVILSIIYVYLYNNPEYFNFLVFFTGTLFVMHYYNDEIKIQSTKRERFFISGTIASVISFSAVYANKLLNITSPFLYVLSGVSFILFLYFSYMLIKKEKDILTNGNLYILFFTFLNCYIPTILISNQSVSVYQIFGFIIFFHYLRWYIYYLNVFKSDKSSLYFYLRTTFNVNFLLIVLYIQHILTRYNSYLIYIFSPSFFYGWTIVHILLSIRKTDF